MVKAISLQDYYNRLEAFYDPDPMIRIAAIHRAGAKLERNPRLRETLQDLLKDKEPLVARYAAITLAQSGDAGGLRHLVQAISRVQGQDREELDGCLRNCVRFPFAVILNERLFIETIPAVRDVGFREVLSKALGLTSDEFYEKSERDAAFRDTFLKIISSLDRLEGLRVRAGSISDVGRVLSEPMGKQPGFLFCPGRRLFLKFQEESVLNRGYIQRGRQVLFVSRDEEGSSDADCLYVFEDAGSRQEQLTPEAMTAFSRQSGLMPGVIVAKWDSPDRVDVLCANGRSFQERYRAQKAFTGQFVLIEEETVMGRSQCHFIPGVRLEPAVIRRIVSDYAAFNNLVLAQLTTIHDDTHRKTGHPRCTVKTERGEDVTTYISAPRERSFVLLRACHVCQAEGQVACDPCKGCGEKPCDGKYSCSRCKGRGTLDDGRECLFCGQSGTTVGCTGKGVVLCPICDGNGRTQCKKCSGSGELSCSRCSGSGHFTCPVCAGTGRATCKVCRGSGRNLHGGYHSFCNGTGKVQCGYCSGAGRKACGTCYGSGSFGCDLCSGAEDKECFYCHGDAQIQCPVCRGAGKLPCGKCRAGGRIRCPYCQGNRLVFDAKVDCLRFDPHASGINSCRAVERSGQTSPSCCPSRTEDRI